MKNIRRCDSCSLSRFFFFQAEDGIRDYKVTGVQTCALPILEAGYDIGPVRGVLVLGTDGRGRNDQRQRHGWSNRDQRGGGWKAVVAGGGFTEIGRASCRGRV